MDGPLQITKSDLLAGYPPAQSSNHLSTETWGEWAKEHKVIVGIGATVAVAAVVIAATCIARSMSEKIAQGAEKELDSGLDSILTDAALKKPASGAGAALESAALKVETRVPSVASAAGPKLGSTALGAEPKLGSAVLDAEPKLAQSIIHSETKLASGAYEPAMSLPKPTGPRLPEISPGKVVPEAYSWNRPVPVPSLEPPPVLPSRDGQLAQDLMRRFGEVERKGPFDLRTDYERALAYLRQSTGNPVLAQQITSTLSDYASGSTTTGNLAELMSSWTRNVPLADVESEFAEFGERAATNYVNNGLIGTTETNLSRFIPAISKFGMPALK